MTRTPESSAIDTEHPWLGLASFTEETRQYFYGREEEVAELARRVQRKLLTVLFGQSGLGKTSILSAGIVPRLRPEGYCPVYVRIDYATELSPSDQIKQAIFRATEASGTWSQAGTAVEGESLWEFLHHRDDILRDAEGKPIIPLLIFDQFEEIFTLAQADDAGRKRAATFIEDLADLVENRPPKALEAKLETDDTVVERFDFGRADYRVLIALREDYLAHLEGVKAAMPSITQNRMRLARMNGQQALAAVMKPGGKLVSQEVAESIVRFVAGGSELPNAEVEPSLLSLICRELNNARIAQGRSEMSADLLAGSNETILNEFYERALADQPAAVRKVIEDELLTESGYRENLAEERVRKAFAAAGAAPDALATLVNRRLLRIEERLDVRRVELTHDVLCGVVRASREQRLEREALEEAEKKLLAQKERERATRKALVRARQIAAGCAVLAIGAIISAIFGYQSMKRAQLAEADAQQVRKLADTSRGEAEKLIVYLLDDFYTELAPVGRLNVIGELAKSAMAYYKGLPTELRTPDTLRNSALAMSRYGNVLREQGKNDEAGTMLGEAEKILRGLRDGGDVSEATVLALARVRGAQAGVLSSGANFAAQIRVNQEILELIKPLLARTDPPKRAQEIRGDALLGIGFGQVRLGSGDAVGSLRGAQEAFRGLNAKDLTYLPATSGYLRAGWVLGEALVREGKEGDAKIVAVETIELADRVLKIRPDHRPVMTAKAHAASSLGIIESGNLRQAEALQIYLGPNGIIEVLLALDTASSSAWNNAAVRTNSIAYTLFRLGRIDEAMQKRREVSAVAGKTNVDGFLARNLVFWNRALAEGLANLGESEAVASALADARKFSAFAAKGKPDDESVNALPGIVNVAEAYTWFIAGKYADARTLAQQVLSQMKAAGEGKLAEQFVREEQSRALGIVVRASYGLGDYAAAEAAARQQLGLQQKFIRRNPLVESFAHESRTYLALAIARQGRQREAADILLPATKFHRDIQARGSDDLVLKVQWSRALLAAALTNPGERKSMLAEAASTFDSLPPGMRRWKEFALIGEEIMREKNK